MAEEKKQTSVVERARAEFLDRPISTLCLLVGAIVVVASATWASRSVVVVYVLPTVYAAVFVFFCWRTAFKARDKGRFLRLGMFQGASFGLLLLVLMLASKASTKRDLLELLPETEAVLEYKDDMGVWPERLYIVLLGFMCSAATTPLFLRAFFPGVWNLTSPGTGDNHPFVK